MVFFDAFDPKPAPGSFPTEITFEYRLVPAFEALPAPEPALPLTLLVPVTTPPVQVPRLVSAGLALSPYVPADDYSSTEPRRRELWLEFEAPPADPNDQFFVRVLATAPDPLLTAEDIAEVPEPPLQRPSHRRAPHHPGRRALPGAVGPRPGGDGPRRRAHAPRLAAGAGAGRLLKGLLRPVAAC